MLQRPITSSQCPWSAALELAGRAAAQGVPNRFVATPCLPVAAVRVLDDGDGIDPTTLKQTFGRFNDSHKREDAEQHGAHGRGRLSFHRIRRFATWHARS
ncbi:ATP-binding protein [Cupriavidus metallidurans]|uniref:ATP-binding protein n=1 Tax=Cupriavidus metallidurans TaxID=119219 RepID=UPI001D13213B|nr:ATP-binding protein [Cupriavidus metallidurans]